MLIPNSNRIKRAYCISLHQQVDRLSRSNFILIYLLFLILLTMTYSFNACQCSMSWFSSYLIGRYQRVKTANSFSAALPTSNHHLYADDTQIYLSLATPDTNCSLNQLRDCPQNVFHWVTNSNLKLNANITECLIIGTVLMVSSVVNWIVFSQHLC